MKTVARLAYAGLCALWTGWVLLALWGWYLAPLLHFTPTLKQAVGLDLILSLLTVQHIPRNDDQYTELYVWCAVMPAMALGWGFAFKHLLP